MKPSAKLPLFAVALITGFALLNSANATTIAVDDWYAINNNNLTGTANVIGGNTTSPVFSNINSPSNIMVFSYFDSVSLEDGNKLSLTFDLTFTLDTVGGTKFFDIMSFGLYNSSTPKATTTAFGADRTTTTSAAGGMIKGWSGFMVHKPYYTSAYPVRFYQKPADPNVNFAGAGGTYTTLDGTGGYSMNFTHGVARTFTLELIRSGDDLLFSGSMGTTLLFGSEVEGAFLAPGSNLFDAFGFYISQGGSPRDTHQINGAAFSNVSLLHTPIPEPSGIALLAIAGAGAMIWTRRFHRA